MLKAVPAGGCAPTRLRTLSLSLFVEVLIAGQAITGQTSPQADQPEAPMFSAGVDLVVLHPAVRDRKGGFVSDLRKENFQVFEDGKPQTIRVFQHEDVPVAVGLVVDNSGSMGRKRDEVTAAALAFVRSSNPQDEMFVVNFNERVSFGLRNTALFSARPGELEAALNDVPANGKTALYDAIDAGLAHLNRATLDKKVLIVISDGGDNASRHTLGSVLERAGRSKAIIYTVGLFDDDDEDSNPGLLKKIASVTGGEAYLPKETAKVVPICRRIAEDIRNQYTIGYVSSNPKLDNSYRTVRVTATGPHGEKYHVRARAGYIAAPPHHGRSRNEEAQRL
jgi:Ca-activated chloride channel family protein